MTALQGNETIVASRYIYGKLATALGAGNVYPGVAPREAAMPLVTFQHWPRTSGGDTNALGGTRVLARLRYLVKVQALTYEEAEPLVKLVDAALQDSDGYQSGNYVSNVTRELPFDMPVQDGDVMYQQVGGYYDLEVSGAS